LTLNFAIGKCIADNGDIIFLMPGHSETFLAGDAEPTMDVDGISVIGLGHGDDRPEFLPSGNLANIVISADNVRFSNCILTPDASPAGAGISISGDFCELDNLVFNSHATHEFTICIGVVTAHGTIIRDCVFYGLDGTAGTTCIAINGSDQITITRNLIQGNFSTGCIENVTDEALQATITHNVIANQSAAGTITMDAAATGVLAYNSLSTRSATLLDATTFDPGDMLCTENYLCNEVDTTGIVIPATASTS
jgi:hypothetical protein